MDLTCQLAIYHGAKEKAVRTSTRHRTHDVGWGMSASTLPVYNAKRLQYEYGGENAHGGTNQKPERLVSARRLHQLELPPPSPRRHHLIAPLAASDRGRFLKQYQLRYQYQTVQAMYV